MDFGDFGFWILGRLDFGFWGRNPKSKIQNPQDPAKKAWILDFGDFGFWGFWGFWILGILDFGDFGILGILDFGFLEHYVADLYVQSLDFGIWGFWILDFGDLGFWILDWGFWMGTL